VALATDYIISGGKITIDSAGNFTMTGTLVPQSPPPPINTLNDLNGNQLTDPGGAMLNEP
jgi:hypothetical protein